MNHIFSKIALFIVVSIVIICSPIKVLAQGGFGLDKTAGAAGYETSGTAASIPDRIQTGVSLVLGIIATVFFGLTLYGGIIWLTARGKEDKVNEAKNILEAAAIGLVIVGASYAITTFVLNRLTTEQIGCCSYETDGGIIFENTDNDSCQQRGGVWSVGDC